MCVCLASDLTYKLNFGNRDMYIHGWSVSNECHEDKGQSHESIFDF